ncbi:hypothetical protein ABIB62_000245 [Mucilaginibacter sp. UYP25]
MKWMPNSSGIGSISQKLCFDGEAYRSYRMNQAAKLIYNKLGAKKKSDKT